MSRVEHIIFPEYELNWFYGFGHVDLPMIMNSVIELRNSPLSCPHFNTIVDFFQATMDLVPDHLTDFQEFFAAYEATQGKCRMAIASGNDGVIKNAAVIHMLQDYKNIHVDIFTTLDDALAWVGVPETDRPGLRKLASRRLKQNG
ncbi:MAG: hypothetical protein ACOC0U_06870 [Desulfovibrionales bacterium]